MGGNQSSSCVTGNATYSISGKGAEKYSAGLLEVEKRTTWRRGLKFKIANLSPLIVVDVVDESKEDSVKEKYDFRAVRADHSTGTKTIIFLKLLEDSGAKKEEEKPKEYIDWIGDDVKQLLSGQKNKY